MLAGPNGDVIRSSISRDTETASGERVSSRARRLLRADNPELRQALDRIASCAAVTLGAPLGAVSMVESSDVTLVGMHGFDRRRTVRAGSFCGEVARLGAALLVADAVDDPRFSSHEYVAAGGVRSYAGAPVRDGDDEVIGAVGAFAGERDAFQPAGLDDLEALAHMVEVVLAHVGPAQIELPRLRRQGWLGVRTLDARRTATAARAGLLILSVAEASPAEDAGLRPTDILFKLDDQILCERADLVAALADREPGSSARITFQRAGQWLERWVKVATRRAGTVGRPTA